MWSTVHVSAFWAQNLPAELTVHQNEHLKPHSLQQSSTLNGATLIFKSSLKTTATFLIMFIRLQYFTLPFISALGYFLFLSLREWNWQMIQKCILFFGKCSWTLLKIWEKICRTWLMCCKFLSSICLILCVSLLWVCFYCRIGCNILFKLNLISQRSNYSCYINCCWFFKLLSKVMGNIAFVFIQSVSRLCSLVGVLHKSIKTPWNILVGCSINWHNVSEQISYNL